MDQSLLITNLASKVMICQNQDPLKKLSRALFQSQRLRAQSRWKLNIEKISQELGSTQSLTSCHGMRNIKKIIQTFQKQKGSLKQIASLLTPKSLRNPHQVLWHTSMRNLKFYHLSRTELAEVQVCKGKYFLINI